MAMRQQNFPYRLDRVLPPRAFGPPFPPPPHFSDHNMRGPVPPTSYYHRPPVPEPRFPNPPPHLYPYPPNNRFIATNQQQPSVNPNYQRHINLQNQFQIHGRGLKRKNGKLLGSNVPEKRKKSEMKKHKPSNQSTPNNLLQIKTTDDLTETENVSKIKNQAPRPQEQTTKDEIVTEEKLREKEAQRLALQLEKEIKEEMRKMREENNTSKQKPPCSNKGKESALIQSGPKEARTVNTQPQNNTQEQNPTTTEVKVNFEQIVDTLYKVVSIKKEDGSIVMRKIPVKRGINDETNDKKVRDNFFNEIPEANFYCVTTGPNSHCTTSKLDVACFIPKIKISSSCLVTVTNLPLSADINTLKNMVKEIGDLTFITTVPELGQATLKFLSPKDAERFCMKFNRKMIDLSIISVYVVESLSD